MPEADAPTPLTYTDDGKVFGHLALWDQCHSGFASECVRPPRSRSDYAGFHLGRLQTQEGDEIGVGKITYGTGHAPMAADARGAVAHYDDTGRVGAYVRAKDGRHGIWLSGAWRSDLPPEGLRDLKANPPSGDWRPERGHLELRSVLAVPVPGFPISLGLAASGEVATLILPGYTDENEEAPVAEEKAEVNQQSAISQAIASGGVVVLTGGSSGTTTTAEVAAAPPKAEPRSKEYIRQRKSIERALTAAVLSTKARNALPRSAFAIPETREYPIHDRAHAADALARASGKPEEARVRRAVCRKYPNMGECARR